MIALESEYLIFQMINGENLLCSADMISVEIVGNQEGLALLDSRTLKHASASVFHYFKKELERESVTVGEFAMALEKALQGLGISIFAEKITPAGPGGALEANLAHLARDGACGMELFFFPKLRNEMRAQLLHGPKFLRFYGLKGCVKLLSGARRWSYRCDQMEDRILEFMRQCIRSEGQAECTMMVE